MNWWILLYFLAFSPFLLSGSRDSQQIDSHEAIRNAVYVSRDGTSVLAVMNDNLYMGQLATDDPYARIPHTMGSEGVLVDESNAQIKCVAVGHITFAIPRSPRAGQNFQCNGLQFSVERCGTAGSCETYEIVARCVRFTDGRCLPGPPSRQGPALEYRLRGTTRIGITEINFAPVSDDYSLYLRQGTGVFGR